MIAGVSESGEPVLNEVPVYEDEVAGRDIDRATRPMIEFPAGTGLPQDDDWERD